MEVSNGLEDWFERHYWERDRVSEREKVEVHKDYLEALRASVSAQSDARASATLAQLYCDACRTIVHVERHLRKANRKCRTQHREIKRLRALTTANEVSTTLASRDTE